MRTYPVRARVLAMVALATTCGTCLAQATPANQRWNHRILVERKGVHPSPSGEEFVSRQAWQSDWNGSSWSALALVSSEGPVDLDQYIYQVDITLQGRVAIVGQNNADPGDPTRPSTQRNYGVSRLGGAGTVSGTSLSGFYLRVTDPDTYDPGQTNLHFLSRGPTGEVRNGSIVNDYNTNGFPNNPLAGMFLPFRGSLVPFDGPFYQGSNTDSGNGSFFNPSQSVSQYCAAGNCVGGRALNFGLEGTGPIGVGILAPDNTIASGDFANYYKFSYTPKRVTNAQSPGRVVSALLSGSSVRYLYSLNSVTHTATSSPSLNAIAWTFPIFVASRFADG